MARPIWYVKLLKKAFPKVKFIAKLTNFPFLGNLFDKLLFEGDDIFYLPMDKTIPINQDMGEYQEYVLPSQILEHFVREANYHFIMSFCICRDSMQCESYPIDLGCLFLGEAVLGINPKLGKLVSKEEALVHLEKCREVGLVHMIGRNLLDKQWLGVKPGYKLLSICNCCPCCCLWRVSSALNPKIGSKIKKMPGVEVRVIDDCIGCGTCAEGICFVDAIKLVEDRAIITDQCRGCGRCVEICPQNAIKISFKEKNLEIKKIINQIERIIDVS
ncbi:MAG: 4Fe-4S ferredoxin [Candidatus Lokiarchaeota archaeon]|nr:4Fe-4S ferredoxin [Candidatus Lokiarchaeota archaeon]MBD3337665.1 4Fe-4S ferredoxin [Candidatus Lokiarchaeota archaeon]